MPPIIYWLDALDTGPIKPISNLQQAKLSACIISWRVGLS
jgi:hypothetical protein